MASLQAPCSRAATRKCVLFSSNRKIKKFRVENHWNEIWQQFDGESINLVITSEILQKYQNLKNLSHLRDDYKELVKLALIYIGSQPSHGITLQRSGAVYKARWTSNVIKTTDVTKKLKTLV